MTRGCGGKGDNKTRECGDKSDNKTRECGDQSDKTRGCADKRRGKNK